MPTVLIIGAGIIGCAAAHALAVAGAKVRVLDARRVGQGATQASAGILAPYIEGHESGPLRELGRRSLDLYDEYIPKVIADSGHDVHYQRNGTVEVALDEAHAVRLRESAAALAREGVRAEWLEGAALREAEPRASTDAVGGLVIPLHGFVAVPDLAAALAAAAAKHGAVITPNASVLSVGPAPGGRVRVTTASGTHEADKVVMAAGSWASQVEVEGAAPLPVRPVRGQLLYVAWPEQALQHVVWGANCYLVPWSNGTVLVGATVEDAGFDERATVAGVRDLLDAACTLVPHLWQASFNAVRVGLRPAGPDALPLLGRSEVVPGLVYAMAHYRNGVLLAPLTGALVRDLVLGQGDEPALQWLTPARAGRL